MKDMVSKIILVIFFFGILIMFYKGCKYNEEITNHKGSTICKYTYCKEFPKTTESHFKYFIQNKEFNNASGRCPDNYKKRIRKFFTVDYSTIDPNKIEVHFTDEITDTAKILKAGFSREDLE